MVRRFSLAFAPALTVIIVGCGTPASPPIAGPANSGSSGQVVKPGSPGQSSAQPSVADAAVEAGKPSIIDGVTVTLESAIIGKAVLDSEIPGSDNLTPVEYLTVRLKVENGTESKKIDYLGLGSGSSSMMVLSDSAGNRYKYVYFGLSRKVAGSAGATAIYPGKFVADVVCFEPPVDGAGSLTLEIPGRYAGVKSDFRFAIQPDFIKRTGQ